MIIDLETRRQAVHLFSGVLFAFLVHLMTPSEALAFLGIAATLTFVFSWLIQHGYKVLFFDWLVKKTERKGKPPASGVTWYFLGVLLVFVASLYFEISKAYVVAAMLIVAIGDSISTGLGRKIGTKYLPHTKTKSYEGSLIGFGSAFFGAAFVLKLSMATTPAIVIAGIGSFVGMLTEAYLRGLDDNLTIPVVAWMAMIISASAMGVL